MIEKVFVRQGTAEAVAASIEPAEKVLFWGLTAPEVFALGAGIVVGCVCCYVGYRYYKNEINVDKSENLFHERKKLKSIRELTSEQEYVSILDSANLREWFNNNRMETEDAKLMIAIPSDKVLNAVGYILDDDAVDLDKFIIQSIFNSQSGTIYKLRFVAFDSVESNLYAKLLKNNGLVILDT